jgi:hypothetical protein
VIDGEWQSASFDEKVSFEKEGQKAKIRVFSSVHQREVFDLLFVDGKATNDEIRMVAKLKLAHGTILGFKADLTETS